MFNGHWEDIAYFRVDALNDDPTLNAGEKAALLDEMLGANAATRALMMPGRWCPRWIACRWRNASPDATA